MFRSYFSFECFVHLQALILLKVNELEMDSVMQALPKLNHLLTFTVDINQGEYIGAYLVNRLFKCICDHMPRLTALHIRNREGLNTALTSISSSSNVETLSIDLRGYLDLGILDVFAPKVKTLTLSIKCANNCDAVLLPKHTAFQYVTRLTLNTPPLDNFTVIRSYLTIFQQLKRLKTSWTSVDANEWKDLTCDSLEIIQFNRIFTALDRNFYILNIRKYAKE
ncbi:unnamed protein product [Didymodactylos carnosus]|uniref:Uncharacterized protein n=1 Tax=Didymodactylos carnosus TaxID=1234261 RepID=A0A816CRY9_9BILA|nr:unnamed protein product [Didymodactylos carnosus]CAF4525831.1 unnamed protein product [Didymodactylos carnosus]